jgi:hypothetical protein
VFAVQVLRFQIDIVQQQATALSCKDAGALQWQQHKVLPQQHLPLLCPHDIIQQQQQQQQRPPGLVDSSYPVMPPLSKQELGRRSHMDSSSSSKSAFAAAALQRRAVSQSQLMLDGSSSSASALAAAAKAAAGVTAANADLFSRRGSDYVTPRASATRASWAVSAPNSSRDLRASVAAGLASSSSSNMPGQLPPLGPDNMGASAVAAIEKLLSSDSYNISGGKDLLHGMLVGVTAGVAALGTNDGGVGAARCGLHQHQQQQQQRQPSQSQIPSSRRHSSKSLFDYADTPAVASTGSVAAGVAGHVGDYSTCAADIAAVDGGSCMPRHAASYDSSGATFGSSSDGSSGDGSSSGMRADMVKAMHEARRAEDLRQRAAELEQARR